MYKFSLSFDSSIKNKSILVLLIILFKFDNILNIDCIYSIFLSSNFCDSLDKSSNSLFIYLL